MAAAGLSSFGLFTSPQHGRMRLSDCTCPICLSITIEPVTMPCGHELCRPCFHQNVEEANLACPMCRTRISTWTRKATRDNKLVNETRWQQIKEAFPERVQRRLEGKEELCSSDSEEDDTLPQNYFQLAEDGAIRREYEEQLQQLEEERLRAIQEEENKSRQLIAQLEEEEQRVLEEQRKRSHEDEKLARELTNELKQPASEKKARQLRSGSALEKFITKTQRNADGTLPETAYPFNYLSPNEKMPKYSASPGSYRDSEFLDDREDSFAPSEDYLYLNSRNNKDSTLGLGIDIKLDSIPFSSPPCSSSASSVILISSTPGSHITTPVTSKKVRKTKLDDWLARKSSTPPKSLISSFKSCSNIPKALEEEEESLGAHIDGDSVSVSPTTFFGVKFNKSTPPVKSEAKYKSTEPVASTSKLPSPSPIPISRSTSSDSLAQEMVHFKPIQACPRTPPKKQPSGKIAHPPVIRSTPLNFSLLSPVKEKGDALEGEIMKKLLLSPSKQKSLQFREAQRQAHTSAFSKTTITEEEVDKPVTPKPSEQAYWSPKKNRVVKVQHGSTSSPDSPISIQPGKAVPNLPDLPTDLVVAETPSPDVATATTSNTNNLQRGIKTPEKDDNPDTVALESTIITISKMEDETLNESSETVKTEDVKSGKLTQLEVAPTTMTKPESQSVILSQSQQTVSSQTSGKVYKMKRRTKPQQPQATQKVPVKRKAKRRVLDPDVAGLLPGSKYDVESWLNHCTESESSLDTVGLVDQDLKLKDDKTVSVKNNKNNAASVADVSSSQDTVPVKKSKAESESKVAPEEEGKERTVFTKVKRKRKLICDAESVASSYSTRSTRSVTRAKEREKVAAQKLEKESKGATGKNKGKKIAEKQGAVIVDKKKLFGPGVFSDGEKENSLDSLDVKLPSRQSKNSQDTIKMDKNLQETIKIDKNSQETIKMDENSHDTLKMNKTSKDTIKTNTELKPNHPRSRLKSKRATADLDFTSGSPQKKKRRLVEVDVKGVEYSPTRTGGKKPMQRKVIQTKLSFDKKDEPGGKLDGKPEEKQVEAKLNEQEVDDTHHLPQEISNQLKQLHDKRRQHDEFNSDKDYREYIEEQDRLLALKLQADFDFEARFHLNSVRRKGSGEEYQLRHGRKQTDYAQFFNESTSTRSRPSRAKRK